MTASVRIENAILVVDDTALLSDDSRPVYEWSVTLDSGECWEGGDLRGPVLPGAPEPSEEEMLTSFLGFLNAAGESQYFRTIVAGPDAEPDPDGNESLFPPELSQWAAENYDEISIVLVEREEKEHG